MNPDSQVSCLGCRCNYNFVQQDDSLKAMDKRVLALEATLSAQKTAYEAFKDVFEDLVNHAQADVQGPEQQQVKEEDVVYTIIAPSDDDESHLNQQ